jgi:hypothetical protein
MEQFKSPIRLGCASALDQVYTSTGFVHALSTVEFAKVMQRARNFDACHILRQPAVKLADIQAEFESPQRNPDHHDHQRDGVQDEEEFNS